jgi:radical SAM enzyme (TIGR01210 family)
MEYRKPAFAITASTRIEGVPSRRLMVALTTSGCSYARSPGGGCAFCGFRNLTAKGDPVGAEDIIAQFGHAMVESLEGGADPVEEIDLYNSGSFLDEADVPFPAAEAIFRKIASKPSLRKILIESRPEFVIGGKEHLLALKHMGAGKILTVGMGLETWRDDIRMDILKKGFTRARFEEAAAILAATGVTLLAYVLLKPPGFTEGEAINDVRDTITYLEELGRKLALPIKIALQPMFVPAHTPLEELYRQGTYTPPRLWSVIEVLRATRATPLEIEVALSDEGLAEGRVAENCSLCTEQARELIASFNEDQKRDAIDAFICPCRETWLLDK